MGRYTIDSIGDYDYSSIWTSLVILLIVSTKFFSFWLKEGNEYYRRLSKKTKRRILLIGLTVITTLWSYYYFYTIVDIDGEILYSSNIETITTLSVFFYVSTFTLKLILISMTVNYLLFLYNTLGEEEYYISKSRELGKSF